MVNIWLYVLVIAPLVRFIIGDSFSGKKNGGSGTLAVKFRKLLLCTALIIGVEGYQIYQQHFLNRPMTPYRMLDISRNASRREISGAVRQKLKMYHPDLTRSTDGVELFKQIRNDGDLLLNGNRRNLYDQLGDFVQREYVNSYSNEDTTSIFILFLCKSIENAGLQFLMAIVISMSIHNLNQKQIQNHLTMLLAIYSADLLVRFTPIIRFDNDLQQMLQTNQHPSGPYQLFWHKLTQLNLTQCIPVLRTFAPFELATLFSACVPLLLTLHNFLGSYWTEVLNDFEFQKYKERCSTATLVATENEDAGDASMPPFSSMSHKELTEAMMTVSLVNLGLWRTINQIKEPKNEDQANKGADSYAESGEILLEAMDKSLDVEFGIFGKQKHENGSIMERVRRKILIFWRGGSDRTLVRSWTEQLLIENQKLNVQESVDAFVDQCQEWKDRWAEAEQKDKKRRMIGPILLLVHVAFSYMVSSFS